MLNRTGNSPTAWPRTAVRHCCTDMLASHRPSHHIDREERIAAVTCRADSQPHKKHPLAQRLAVDKASSSSCVVQLLTSDPGPGATSNHIRWNSAGIGMSPVPVFISGGRKEQRFMPLRTVIHWENDVEVVDGDVSADPQLQHQDGRRRFWVAVAKDGPSAQRWAAIYRQYLTDRFPQSAFWQLAGNGHRRRAQAVDHPHPVAAHTKGDRPMKGTASKGVQAYWCMADAIAIVVGIVWPGWLVPVLTWLVLVVMFVCAGLLPAWRRMSSKTSGCFGPQQH
jgi:hypothetical protein